MQFQFDATQVAPSTGGLPPIPAGWYPAIMNGSELKATSDGSGQRLNLQFQILDGEFKGRMIFTGLNVQNANPVTQEYAYKDLSAICHAVNVLRMTDTQELHNKPLYIKLKIKPKDGDYEERNEVTGYRSVNDATLANQSSQPAQAAPSAQPWQAPAQTAAPAQAPAATAQPWQQPAATAPAQAAPAQPAQAAPGSAPPWGAQPAAQPAAPAQAAPAQQAPAQPAAAAAAPPWAASAAAGAPPPWATPAA